VAEVWGDEVGQGESPGENPLGGDHHASEHGAGPQTERKNKQKVNGAKS